MRLEIRRRGVKVTEELRVHLRERLRLALGRFARSIELVRVYLRGVTGPRGGLRKKCRIVVELPRRGRVVVTGVGDDIFAVIARTANRVRFAVRRHIKQRLSRRRPPRAVPARGSHNQGVETMKNRTIILSDTDHQRLEALIETARYDASLHEDYLDALEGELKRAQIVPQSEVPNEVITMNSVVRLRDLDTDEVDEFQLVYPTDADMAQQRISVLAPVGTAILGYQLGDVIEWPVPAGLRRLRVERVSCPSETSLARFAVPEMELETAGS